METSVYYEHQALARGHATPADVIADVERNAGMYDRILLPWLPADRNKFVYEVACGAGICLKWLSMRGYLNAAGSDLSDVQIALAQANGVNASLRDAMADLKSRPDGSIDCLIALDFYEHLPKDVLLDFLKDAHRVLAPSGHLILRGPNGDSPLLGRALYNDITHCWALTSVAFVALLQMFGFGTVKFKDDTLASFNSRRWLRVPLAWMGQTVLHWLFRLATRENIRYFSSSFFVCATK